MNFLKNSHLALGIVLCPVIGIMANVYPGKVSSASEGMTKTQDVRSLDRRISSLEQRLYSIESSISRLQQSAVSQRSPVPQSSARDQEINLIRGEMQALQLRLSEIECGLLKLDERTTVSVRDNRKSAGGKPADPCRLNPATPLRLSTRP
jgi:predicted RNase H-like nuclease (RuvC/YqgF family)